MGRPKSGAKREAILDAAACHFLSEGYGRTSMDAIAAAANVSKQTVYSHFSNKDELFRQCILSKVRAYGLDVADFDPAMPLDAALTEIGHRFLGLLGDDDVIRMHQQLIAETATFPKLANTFYETGPKATIDAIATFIAANTAAGQSAVADPQEAASDFLLLIEGHYMKRRLMHTAVPMTAQERNDKVTGAVDKILRLYDTTEAA
ncbi:MAG: TetR/AcrR family transcriptional regulator [Pseudomonadota bacterium]